MTARLIRLHPDDDVAVALSGLPAGTVIGLVDGEPQVLSTREHPPELGRQLADGIGTVGLGAGHKVALRELAEGEPVRKYGQPIGRATRPIDAGEHVHDHNLGFAPDLAAAPGTSARELDVPDDLPRTFLGYPGGGTRNYVAIVTSVHCAASTARLIARRFEDGVDGCPNVDGVFAVTHDSGCGMVLGSPGATIFERTLVNTARHPNVGAVLVLGLGCEMLEAAGLASRIADEGSDGRPEPRPEVEVLLIQECGGVAATVAAGVDAVRRLATAANRRVREPIGVDKLTLAVKCGGSDGFSGITANPALGHAADLLVALGGRVVLGETPEIFGAERLLASRASDPDVGAELLRRVQWWQGYVADGQGTLDANPSPGNHAGGITTIVEKSLGAVAKAGTSPLRAVVDYAEPVAAAGLTFMDTPGYDPVSITGMVAGGANVVVFTTGRGSVSGGRPSPCVKVATNHALAAKMSGDLDLDAGVVLDGVSVAEFGAAIFRTVVDVASGRRTASEQYDADDFVWWHRGALV